ncbi:hypothetical protein AB205_0077330, partial [Aquarana catesbeiana]
MCLGALPPPLAFGHGVVGGSPCTSMPRLAHRAHDVTSWHPTVAVCGQGYFCLSSGGDSFPTVPSIVNILPLTTSPVV